MQSNQQHKEKFIQKILPKPMPPPWRAPFDFSTVISPYSTTLAKNLQDQENFIIQLILLGQQDKKRFMMQQQMDACEVDESSKRIQRQKNLELQRQERLELELQKYFELQRQEYRQLEIQQGAQIQWMLLEQKNKKRLMLAQMEQLQDEGDGSSKRVKVKSTD
ncbi:hypothetical protein EYC80_008201 [Monilinia laxa]|uniref:Uncharacterized protein n=1 Tax=Monilinia laxa TaxID=61186 RepID=A0A5N6JVQ5_MONLA|nr:hypothetical protein EYC80_008201 [Monilinia laxa]